LQLGWKAKKIAAAGPAREPDGIGSENLPYLPTGRGRPALAATLNGERDEYSLEGNRVTLYFIIGNNLVSILSIYGLLGMRKPLEASFAPFFVYLGGSACCKLLSHRLLHQMGGRKTPSGIL
jgi:hypothetical protein